MSSVELDSAALAARTILESSGETYRAEETALRMCNAYGLKDPQIMAFPTGFVLSAQLQDTRDTRVFRVQERSIRLDRINEVNTISRLVVKGEINAREALKKLQGLQMEAALPLWKSCLFYASAAAFFTVMFGGGVIDFILSFLIGFLVQSAQQPLVRLNIPSQLRAFLLGFFAAFSASLLLVLVKGSQEAVITGIIMPLLPGLAMTNAVRDTMRGDLLSGLGRGAEALISAVLLSAGVAAALMLRGMIWTA